MPLSTFLGDSSVSQLRGVQWLALSDTGHRGTATIVDDTGGGGATTWAYGGTIACRIDPLTGNETLQGARISDRSTHVVTVPPGTVVDTDDRFVIDGRGTFEVTAVQQRTGELARFFEVVPAS